jgi:hypothetical protein
MSLKQMAATAILATAAVGAVAADAGHSKVAHLPKFNPHPQEIYEITLTVHDAPGPMEQGWGYISYSSDSIQCVPHNLLLHDSTAPTVYSQTMEFDPVKKSNGKIFRPIVALDLMEDSDFYGKGICHWEISEVVLGTGINTNQSIFVVLFGGFIKQSDIKEGQTVTTYFLKSDYNDPEHQTIGIAGSVKQFTEQDYLNTPEAERSAKFFSITFVAKKLVPNPALQHLIRDMYWPAHNFDWVK